MTTATGVKLLDFGLAKSIATENDVTITGAGTVLGTVAYMSPEQAQGSRLDARSDIFSFGALLYEMVSGDRAFAGTTTPQILSALLRDDPPPLWPSSPLEPTIRKCLAKRPAERFQTIEEVVHALELVGSAPRKEAPSIAVLPFTSMSPDPDNEYFSDGIAEEIINALTQLEGLRVAARTSSFSFKGKPVEIGEIARRLNVRHLLQGSVRRAAARDCACDRPPTQSGVRYRRCGTAGQSDDHQHRGLPSLPQGPRDAVSAGPVDREGPRELQEGGRARPTVRAGVGWPVGLLHSPGL
jgi:serine/threonine protein kinase